jgi:hypothetical protein
MVLLDLGIGKLQIYPSVKGAKKVFTLRKPPTWALTKQASSPIQEAQWLHMLLSAHQGKFVYGRIYYLTKKGAKKQISAPAAVAGLMRRKQKGADPGYVANLVDIAAEIVMTHKVLINETTKQPEFKADGITFELAYEQTPAMKAEIAAKLMLIPDCPVLTKEERFSNRYKKSLKEADYFEQLGRWDAVTGDAISVKNKAGQREAAPAFPAKAKKPAASGKSVFDEFF